MVAFNASSLSSDKLDLINQFDSAKVAPRITSQTPAAGTPLVAGMTVTVHAVSFSDVPFAVIQPDAPAAIKNIPIAELETWTLGDPQVQTVVNTGVIPDTDTQVIANKITAGLTGKGLAGTVSGTDAISIIHSINNSGFFRV